MFEQSTLDDRLRAGAPANWSELKAVVRTLGWNAAVLVVAGTWIVFWGLVMRLHVVQGSLPSAAVVGLLFVVPALVGISAFLGPLPDPHRLIPS